MRAMLIGLFVLVVLAVGAFGVALAIGPAAPAPLGTIEESFKGVDFSDMPAPSHFAARDGTSLSYRLYPGAPDRIAVLAHGSSAMSSSMHVVARAIHARGWTAYALSMRGHDHTGRPGDIDYVGQLDDDLADFVKTVLKGRKAVLLGFSSGGGFVSRIAGGADAKLFERFVLLSPQPPPRSDVMRPNAGGWVSVAIPRLIAIQILSGFGIHAFDGLPTIRFALPPGHRDDRIGFYSWRLMSNYGPTDDFAGDIARSPAPIVLIAGRDDDLFYADKYAAMLKLARPDLKIILIPGMRHMDMTVKPAAVEAVADAVTGGPVSEK
jgi:pimeloyl-ACP methyl ester carboxylesterase